MDRIYEVLIGGNMKYEKNSGGQTSGKQSLGT
jgi:hypothetical protein